MSAVGMTLVARACTEAEVHVLAQWSAAHLPQCRAWVAARGLQPPIAVLEKLQDLRFNAPPAPASLQDLPLSLIGLSPAHASAGRRELGDLAEALLHDLSHYQAFISDRDSTQAFVTASRALRRFERAISRLQNARLSLTEIDDIIVTVFSLSTTTLYIPRWLTDALPRTPFAPNQLFYQARRASLIWLLLDAIVMTGDGEFRML